MILTSKLTANNKLLLEAILSPTSGGCIINWKELHNQIFDFFQQQEKIIKSKETHSNPHSKLKSKSEIKPKPQSKSSSNSNFDFVSLLPSPMTAFHVRSWLLPRYYLTHPLPPTHSFPHLLHLSLNYDENSSPDPENYSFLSKQLANSFPSLLGITIENLDSSDAIINFHQFDLSFSQLQYLNFQINLRPNYLPSLPPSLTTLIISSWYGSVNELPQLPKTCTSLTISCDVSSAEVRSSSGSGSDSDSDSDMNSNSNSNSNSNLRPYFPSLRKLDLQWKGNSFTDFILPNCDTNLIELNLVLSDTDAGGRKVNTVSNGNESEPFQLLFPDSLTKLTLKIFHFRQRQKHTKSGPSYNVEVIESFTEANDFVLLRGLNSITSLTIDHLLLEPHLYRKNGDRTKYHAIPQFPQLKHLALETEAEKSGWNYLTQLSSNPNSSFSLLESLDLSFRSELNLDEDEDLPSSIFAPSTFQWPPNLTRLRITPRYENRLPDLSSCLKLSILITPLNSLPESLPPNLTSLVLKSRRTMVRRIMILLSQSQFDLSHLIFIPIKMKRILEKLNLILGFV